MAERLNDKELVSFKEVRIASSIQVDTLAQLMIEKGFITEQELSTKLKQVQMYYQDNLSG